MRLWTLWRRARGTEGRAGEAGDVCGGKKKDFGFCCFRFFDVLLLPAFFTSSSSLSPLSFLLILSPSASLYTQLYLYEPVVLTEESSQRNQQESLASAFSSVTSPPPVLSLEAGARRRRRSFASLEAALLSLARKSPFSLFDRECARIYAEEGMVEAEDQEMSEKGGSVSLSSSSSTAATAASSPTFSSSFSSSTAAVSLAASPEDEVAVILEAGPLGAEAGRKLGLVAAPVLVAAGGRGSGGSGGGSGGGIQKNQNPHAPLARAAPRTARLLPRGELEVHEGLGHLGPFEDPGLVGERAAAAFVRAAEGRSWRRRSPLPPEEKVFGSLSSKL